jgi:hypothetical protein
VKDEQEALFLPSQTDDPGGLGLQGMSAEELAEMLDGDGEDVIGSNTRLSPDWDMAGMDDDDRGARQSPERQKDVWDDSEFGATQADGTGSRVRPPLMFLIGVAIGPCRDSTRFSKTRNWYMSL